MYLLEATMKTFDGYLANNLILSGTRELKSVLYFTFSFSTLQLSYNHANFMSDVVSLAFTLQQGSESKNKPC